MEPSVRFTNGNGERVVLSNNIDDGGGWGFGRRLNVTLVFLTWIDTISMNFKQEKPKRP